MANECKHDHPCFECKTPYTCWNPECLPLAGETLMLCPVCSYLVWVKSRGIEETGIVQ